MKNFVLRARKAPVDSKRFLTEVGKDSHVEILAHVLMNALFVSKSHRDDVVVHLVLESSQDYSRTISFDGAKLGDLDGFNEAALLGNIATALDAGKDLAKDTSVGVRPGVSVRTVAFEQLVRELSETSRLYVLDRKGADIRSVCFDEQSTFILTDHIPMPRKAFNSLKRLGAEKISLGKQMLFASQCVVLIHSEMDRSD
jgi:tRNA (pseudouridine54-N1)-methyltransferase